MIASLKSVLIQVEAEELSDISEEYGVTAVPFFAIVKVTSDRKPIYDTHMCMDSFAAAWCPSMRTRSSLQGKCVCWAVQISVVS